MNPMPPLSAVSPLLPTTSMPGPASARAGFGVRWRARIDRLAAPSLAALCLAGGAWLAAGCGKGGAGAPPPEPVVEVAAARPAVTEVEDALPAVGTIEADERVVLQPETPGVVETIEFTEGQRVRKGDLLFRLRSRKEEAQLAQSRADKELARSTLARARTLAGTKAISQQELDQMESTLAAREASFELESRRLEERTIAAPFDGVVGPRQVSVGQYVNAGTPLVTLVADARVKVSFRLAERHLARLRTGMTGRVRVSAHGTEAFVGTLDVINPEVDVATRTVQARLIVLNPDGRLRPGMFARVELVLGTRPGALVVAESALIPSLDSFSVFVVDQERARLKPVKLGVRLPGRVELREGITAGAEVIVSGTQKLVDGTRVKAGVDRADAVGGAGAKVTASP